MNNLNALRGNGLVFQKMLVSTDKLHHKHPRNEPEDKPSICVPSKFFRGSLMSIMLPFKKKITS